MFVIDVVLEEVSDKLSDYIVELLKDAGSDTCGSTFDVSINKDKNYMMITFEKDVPSVHEAYFDVIHELTDASVINLVTTIERVL